MKGPAAVVLDDLGNEYCGACGPIALEEQRRLEAFLVLDVACRVYTINPHARPDDDPADRPPKQGPSEPAGGNTRSSTKELTTPGRMRPAERFIVRHNGRVVDEARNGKNGSGKA